jgi:hypothetical protein
VLAAVGARAKLALSGLGLCAPMQKANTNARLKFSTGCRAAASHSFSSRIIHDPSWKKNKAITHHNNNSNNHHLQQQPSSTIIFFFFFFFLRIGTLNLRIIRMLLLRAVFFATAWSSVSAFLLSPTKRRAADRCLSVVFLKNNKWSVTDDWNGLSGENPRNTAPDSREIFNQDMAWRSAVEMQKQHDSTDDSKPVVTPSKDDVWLQDAISQIVLEDDSDSDVNNDDSLSTDDFVESIGNEIAMLVRCNESPQDLLIQQGRALAPLSTEERNDPAQLVVFVDDDNSWQATPFFQQAVATMFHKHSVDDHDHDEQVLDAPAVASWMTKSLNGKKVVGPHDHRVTSTISLHGTFLKGYLTLGNFQDLYLKAVVGEISPTDGAVSSFRALRRRATPIQAVWRDIRNNGILSPKEQERNILQEEINAKGELQISALPDDMAVDMIMDECEILEETFEVSQGTDREGTSSHELVELARDHKTPIWVRDGEFGMYSIHLVSVWAKEKDSGASPKTVCLSLTYNCLSLSLSLSLSDYEQYSLTKSRVSDAFR